MLLKITARFSQRSILVSVLVENAPQSETINILTSNEIGFLKWNRTSDFEHYGALSMNKTTTKNPNS